MSIAKHCLVNSVKSEFGNIKEVEFYFIFLASDIWNISDIPEITGNGITEATWR